MRRAILVLTAAAGLTLAACGGSSDDGNGGGGDSSSDSNAAVSCTSLIGQPVGTSSDSESLDNFPGCDAGGTTFTKPGANGCYKDGAASGMFFWIADVMAGAPGGTWQKIDKGASVTEMAEAVGC